MRYFIEVRTITKTRFDEIKCLREMCDKLPVEKSIIIKSSIMLLLYNTIEGCFSVILNTLFDYINDNNDHIFNLNDRLQKIYYMYYIKTIGTNTNKFAETIKQTNLAGVRFESIEKNLNLFSGNLDAKKIREVSAEIGVGIPEKYKGNPVGMTLLTVKSLRNKLAHGEQSFSVACRDFSLKGIDDICDDVQVFLNLVINRFEDYIVSGKLYADNREVN